MAEVKFDEVLDVSGKLCPIPVIETKRCMESLTTGKILKIIIDERCDPVAPDNVMQWARDYGHKVLQVIKSGEETHIYIQKA